ncbi:Ciliogenesis-associated TTC17-interacting protein [Intoshia linei]|uniref:Ciliogenesis-associated TTC17-interacting protein n=1 Tax=Intoshia linei TaxID=1819745 RepID=A0A177AV16_9BILA|nr:Ciliogenesis-associated TTC17-interacting protein [Intoshia linei]
MELNIESKSSESNVSYASKSALSFLNDITPIDIKNVLFNENLETINDDDVDTKIGDYSVDMESIIYRGMEAINIHAIISGTFDNVEVVIDVKAIVSPKSLVTIEQVVREYTMTDKTPLERYTYVEKCDAGYNLSKTINDEDATTSTIELSKSVGLIFEGSNLILQRLLIKKGVPKNFSLPTITNNLNIINSHYKQIDTRTIHFEDKPYSVFGIQRYLKNGNDLPHIWNIYGLRNGMIVDRIQVGQSARMRLIKIPDCVEDLEEYVVPTFEKKVLNWNNDIELKSMMIDKQVLLTSEYSTYIRDNPEIQQMLSLFLEQLLINKPDDVFEAAAQFFSSFKRSNPDQSCFKKFLEKKTYSENIKNTDQIKYIAKYMNKNYF